MTTSSQGPNLDNEASDEDNDDEGEEEESNIVFQLREGDKYPLLPDIPSGMPLDKQKKLLRQFVRAVRSKSIAQMTFLPAHLSAHAEYQNMPGRTPWAKIRDQRDAYIPKKSQHKDHVLDDPSRMSENAVRGYLKVWTDRQNKGKGHAVLFRNPVGDNAESENLSSARKAKGKRREWRDVSDKEGLNGEGHGSSEVDSPDGDVTGEDDEGGDNGVAVMDVETGEWDDGGEANDGGEDEEDEQAVNKDLIQAASRATSNSDGPEIPTIPSGVGMSKEERQTFLSSLCNHGDYSQLLALLATAKVCIGILVYDSADHIVISLPEMLRS